MDDIDALLNDSANNFSGPPPEPNRNKYAAAREEAPSPLANVKLKPVGKPSAPSRPPAPSFDDSELDALLADVQPTLKPVSKAAPPRQEQQQQSPLAGVKLKPVSKPAAAAGSMNLDEIDDLLGGGAPASKPKLKSAGARTAEPSIDEIDELLGAVCHSPLAMTLTRRAGAGGRGAGEAMTFSDMLSC
jgi:hypothetical protein